MTADYLIKNLIATGFVKTKATDEECTYQKIIGDDLIEVTIDDTTYNIEYFYANDIGTHNSFTMCRKYLSFEYDEV